MVVAEHTIGPKSGKFVERVGSHHPKTKQTVFNSDRIKYWISVGAKPTDRVHNMLVSEKIIEGRKVNVLPQKTPVVKEAPAAEEAKAPVDAPAEGEEAVAPAEPVEEASETPAEEASKEVTEEKPEAETPEGGEEKAE